MIIDDDESELAILDLIQVEIMAFFYSIVFNFLSFFLFQIIVEALDNIFENACELDLIYHPDKVHIFPKKTFFSNFFFIFSVFLNFFKKIIFFQR